MEPSTTSSTESIKKKRRFVGKQPSNKTYRECFENVMQGKNGTLGGLTKSSKKRKSSPIPPKDHSNRSTTKATTGKDPGLDKSTPGKKQKQT